eukprot:648123-Rhodomonas_salina.6
MRSQYRASRSPRAPHTENRTAHRIAGAQAASGPDLGIPCTPFHRARSAQDRTGVPSFPELCPVKDLPRVGWMEKERGESPSSSGIFTVTESSSVCVITSSSRAAAASCLTLCVRGCETKVAATRAKAKAALAQAAAFCTLLYPRRSTTCTATYRSGPDTLSSLPTRS